MRSHRPIIGCLFAVSAALSLGLVTACADDVALGEQDKRDGAAGTLGPALGTGGAIGTGGGTMDAAPSGTGGRAPLDAPVIATGGKIGTGGAIGLPGTGGMLQDGGAPGAGGKLGTGGAGSTGDRCGTIVGITCPTGYFCDLASQCGVISDAAGSCKPTGPGITCGAVYDPVCGCDGQTYPNDCTRVVQGVLKAHEGACAGGSGGATGTGGIHMDGGAPGSGGRTGTGGATGAGGSDRCGGIAGETCGAGLFCDLDSQCGKIVDATGTCVLTGSSGGCIAVWDPVCGCDGKTYGNDCERMVAGMLKASDGACSGDAGTTGYPSAYLAWQAPGGTAGVGPAVVVSGKGWADVWQRTYGFSPETPPSSATKTYTLTSAQTDDLFARLAAINFSSLPHPGLQGWECYPRLYFRLCEGCTATTLSYPVPEALSPEMDPVWLWFEQVFGDYTYAKPSFYCAL